MDPDTTMTTRQNVVGDEEHEHSHPANVHTHDHYHVSHHHTGGLMGEFEHRAHYHHMSTITRLWSTHTRSMARMKSAPIMTAPLTSMTMGLRWAGEHDERIRTRSGRARPARYLSSR